MKFFLLSLITALAITCQAETLKITVPYAPGGNTDITARLYAKELAKQNIDVVIINRPGAEGKVGQNEFINNAKPDGSNLLFTGNGSIISNSIENIEDYNSMKRLVPVIQTSILGQILLTKSNSPYKTYSQLVAASQEKQINIGTGSSATRFFAEELFAGNKNVVIVPYNGDAPVMSGLLSNTVDAAFVTFIHGNKVVSGELNGLAVTSDLGSFGVKSFKELGINKNISQWNGFFAPPGTSIEDRDKWFNIIKKIKQNTELRESIQNVVNSQMAPTKPPEEFSNFIELEYKKSKR
jgi:tripartite-type tricarboxylate transporter receptor subunit TctC